MRIPFLATLFLINLAATLANGEEYVLTIAELRAVQSPAGVSQSVHTSFEVLAKPDQDFSSRITIGEKTVSLKGRIIDRDDDTVNREDVLVKLAYQVVKPADDASRRPLSSRVGTTFDAKPGEATFLGGNSSTSSTRPGERRIEVVFACVDVRPDGEADDAKRRQLTNERFAELMKATIEKGPISGKAENGQDAGTASYSGGLAVGNSYRNRSDQR